MQLSIVLSAQPAQFAAATFKGDIDSNLAEIASLGYDGAELAIRNPALLDAVELERQVRSHGLRVPAIGTGQAWGEEGLSFTDADSAVRRAAIERVKSHIPLAARLEALIIIGLIRGIVRPGIPPQQAGDWLVDAIVESSQAAQESGVRIALEPINRYETTLVNTVQQGLDLVERVGAANFGLLLDTFHMNIEEPGIEASIRTCGDRIFHVHVADSNRWHPGAGHLDFRSILGTLRSVGYAGWISGEFMPQPDALAAARNGIGFLKQQLAAIGDRASDRDRAGTL
jgi:sugar phosphate isomerase/epimerase